MAETIRPAELAVNQAPDLVKDLITRFIENKELTERAKIRLQIKSVLDFLSVDTTYPPVPAIDGKKPPQLPAPVPAGQPLFQADPGLSGRLGVVPPQIGIGDVLPAPGVV